MPRLILKFEDRVLKEFPVGLMVTIGRLPDNTVVIDNPAVSSHHASVFRAGDDYVVEDLESTNGTFVNEQRVSRRRLQHHDVLLVGKHTLVFDQTGGDSVASEEAKPLMSKMGKTVFLDTEQHKALLARLNIVQPGVEKPAGVLATARMTKAPAAPARAAVLRVLDGAAPADYRLDAHTSFIGKADTSLVHLKGWFKPRVAVAISRNGHGYIATLMGGKTLINGLPLRGRHALRDGDVLEVGGLTILFNANG